jgi:hypothetical protein
LEVLDGKLVHEWLQTLQTILHRVDRSPQLVINTGEHDSRVVFHNYLPLEFLFSGDIRKDENDGAALIRLVSFDPHVEIATDRIWVLFFLLRLLDTLLLGFFGFLITNSL